MSDKCTVKKDLLGRPKKRKSYGASNEDNLQFDHYLGRLTELDPYQMYEHPSAKLVAEAAKEAKPRKPIPWGGKYQPSLAFWRSDVCSIATCNWAQYITKGMMVDAKVIMPLGLLQCLLDDLGETGGWEVMGTVGSTGKYLRPMIDEKAKREAQQKQTDKRFPRK